MIFTNATLTTSTPRAVDLVAILAWFVSASCTESNANASGGTTPDSVSNATARAIIADVANAAGGQQSLDAIRTLAVQYVHTRFPSTSADGTEASTPQSTDVLQVRDFNNGRHLYEVYSAGENEAWERVVVLPDGAFSVNLLTNETSRVAGDAMTGARFGGLQLRWYVYTALSEATTAGPNLRHARDTTVNDRTVRVVTYPGADTETIELWIDEETSLIVRRQISVSDPLMGNAVARLEFGDYQDVGGIPMPMEVTVYTENRLFERFEMQEIRLNSAIQESAFEPPVQ